MNIQEKNLAAYRSITNGVTKFRTQFNMSPVKILNNETFPILTGTGGNFMDSIKWASAAAAVGGFFGSGRYAAFSHEGNFTPESDGLEGAALLRENIFSWLGNRFQHKRIGFTNGHSEWLGLNDFSSELLEWGREKGVEFEAVGETGLASYDIIIAGNPWENFSQEEEDALINFVENGGGLLILSLGWSWAENKNDASCDNLPVNALGRKLGFKFENGEGDSRYLIGETFGSPNSPKPLETVKAEGKTDDELSDLLAADAGTVYALEGKYIILHLTNELWKKVKTPKRVIDNLDTFYEKEYDFIGRISHPYSGKLWYITNTRTNVFMYMSGDHCGMGAAGANHFIKLLEGGDDWNTVFPGWGFGHEVGHAMVNNACGGLFQPSGTGESWNNVINMYAHKELGYNSIARNQGASYANNFYGEDRKYAALNGTDYDLLPDSERIFDILLSTTCVFVKLPMLIIDYYGWDGMSKLFQTAAADTKNGVKLRTDEEKTEYMIVNMSKAYNVDLSPVFTHWRFPVTENVKDLLKTLPKEEILTGIYKTTKNFDKYTLHINKSLPTN